MALLLFQNLCLIKIQSQNEVNEVSFVLTRFFQDLPEPLTSFLMFLLHIRIFLTGIKF
jgi:hypothetical protein